MLKLMHNHRQCNTFDEGQSTLTSGQFTQKLRLVAEAQREGNNGRNQTLDYRKCVLIVGFGTFLTIVNRSIKVNRNTNDIHRFANRKVFVLAT